MDWPPTADAFVIRLRNLRLRGTAIFSSSPVLKGERARPRKVPQGPKPQPQYIELPATSSVHEITEPDDAQKPSATTPLESRLPKGSTVNGKLYFEGPVVIDGKIDGELSATDTITVAENGLISSRIEAQSVVIAGTVKADVKASCRIEIRPSGRVLGELAAAILMIHEGALFEGRAVTNEAPQRPKTTSARPSARPRPASTLAGPIEHQRSEEQALALGSGLDSQLHLVTRRSTESAQDEETGSAQGNGGAVQRPPLRP